ncbi:MAG: hypothetical protein RIA64_09845 [Rhodospirillales bacterium]
MPGENNDFRDDNEQQSDGNSSYERSSIQFPYFDLSECLRVAAAISANNGAGDCSDDQIAAWIDMSPKSSGYRSRMSAARLFGLIESGATSGSRLSDLALKALDPDRSRAAKVEAFMNVPLFTRVYENWAGQQVPPSASLERALVAFGVAEKQKARARQVLERSAQEANFYESGKDRLVKPGMKGAPPPSPANEASPGSGQPRADNGSKNVSSGGVSSEYHPFISGLLQTLPEPHSVWSRDQRKKWLATAEGIFDLIYEDDGSSRGQD